MNAIKKCKFCKKEHTRIKSIYCSANCRVKYLYKTDPAWRESHKLNSQERYLKIKNTPEFKEDRRVRFQGWVERNRSKFNELCNKNTKKWYKRIYTDRTSRGRCVGCGGKIVENKNPKGRHYLNCLDCRIKRRGRTNERNETNENEKQS